MINASNMQVFVVEDSVIDYRMLQRRLTRDGFSAARILHFEGLDECYSASLTHPPEIIFLDLNIDKSTGIETFQRFISLGFESPVIILSGKDDLAFARGAVRLGAQDFIVKSQLRSCNLRQTIGYAVDRFALVNEVRRHAEFKSKFLAHMSHEIRTPLNGVMGLTEILLQSKNLTSDQSHMLQTIAASGQHLSSIVSNVLDLSKLEANRMDQELKRCEIRATIDEVLDLFLKDVSTRPLTLTTEISSEVPRYVYSDPRYLKQVLFNLVGNAVKFTEQGQVTVTIKPQFDANESGSGTYKFEVIDTGPGISLADQQQLFGDYQQLAKDRQQGTGLGLAITQNLIRLLGGEITLTSTEGQGSCFSFELPLTSEHVFSIERVDMKGKKALILSSSDTRGHLIKTQLEKRQLQSCVQLLSITQTSGLLSEHERFPSFDVLVVDTYGVDESLVEELHRRCDRLLANKLKPVVSIYPMPRDLETAGLSSAHAKVIGALSEAKLYRALACAFGGLPTGNVLEAAQVLDQTKVAGWSVLVADDNSVNRLVAKRFLEALGHTVCLTSDGKEAVAAASRSRFDLILMDCKMPNMDGLEATKIIRELPDYQRNVPICAVTANAFEEDRKACLASGMNYFITKPLTIANLSAVVAEIANTNRDVATPFEDSANDMTETSMQESLLDASVLGSLKDLNSTSDPIPFLDDLIGTFLREAPSIVSDLTRAINGDDARKSEHLAHKLKGFARNLGARQLADLCENLEVLSHSESLEGELELAQAIECSYQRTAELLTKDWLTEGSIFDAA